MIDEKEVKRLQKIVLDDIAKIFIRDIKCNHWDYIGHVVPPKPTHVKYFVRLSINEDVK